MDSEDALIRQVEATQRANPGLRQLVYRNSVHAMPWYKTVLAKLQDERYSGFFLRFGATAPLPNGSYYSPPCDSTYSPVRSCPFLVPVPEVEPVRRTNHWLDLPRPLRAAALLRSLPRPDPDPHPCRPPGTLARRPLRPGQLRLRRPVVSTSASERLSALGCSVLTPIPRCAAAGSTSSTI